MTIQFDSPSFRAASSDLTISISPLGLVELADEEFEVHGPRLNRYAQNWAFYLGQHWSYRRELGEPQVTFNYCKAFADFITNFTFGKGINFRSPKETEAIVPGALDKVWTVDNNKEDILYQVGQMGAVSGDVFIKIAWEPEWMDSAGRVHPGHVRIIPLNSAYAFPEWHPHDRDRLLRFKLKYRFWGTSLEGTRQVFTYTELITDEQIEEYINDELIDQRPNPLGLIPIVHIANVPVAGSPWGLSDINEIVNLNREYNEKATDISDIINYHAAPVTVITGAKASQLEKGPKKVWGGLPKDAQVFNLEMSTGLEGPLAYLAELKRAMHEMTGVPETALGALQPISNTSGVALAIQYQPLYNRYNLKKVQYSKGFQKVNEYILLTLSLYEPEALVYDPTTSTETDTDLDEYQVTKLDLNDPISFQTICHWPEPLPLDKTVLLNEIMIQMQLGLQSREGALRELGEEFPDIKLAEIQKERIEDATRDGALQLLQAQIQANIMDITGMQPQPDGSVGAPEPQPQSPGKNPDGTNKPAPIAPVDQVKVMDMQEQQRLREKLVVEAFGPRIPNRRNPDNTD